MSEAIGWATRRKNNSEPVGRMVTDQLTPRATVNLRIREGHFGDADRFFRGLVDGDCV
jgi:hypothetical protein